MLTARIVAFLLVMWAVFAGIAVETYRTEWVNASMFAGNVATLIEEGITRDIELYDMSLKALADNAADPDVALLTPVMRQRVLFDQSAGASGLGSLLVLDKGGKVVADSKGRAPPHLDLSDRDYFVAQRDGSRDIEPFVSHPFRSRITGKYGFGLSRPRVTPDGAFDGVVVGTMMLSHFAAIFESVHLPYDSTITLMHSDGTILMRAPESAIGASLRSAELYAAAARAPAGMFCKSSAIDGVERLFAYRRIGSHPIYLSVGLSTRQVLAHWRWQMGAIGGAFLLLSAIIILLGIALTGELDRRTDAERTLAQLAATDGLTGLANRRRFDSTLDVEWRRAVRERRRLALLMIDGDFFKGYNDTYGHLEGDAALRAIASAICECATRPGDLVARFGGEEFVVLLPDTDSAGAFEVASAIRRTITGLALAHRGSPFGVLTVSIGVASRSPPTGASASMLVEGADAALYKAKAEGRDRVVLADLEHAFGPAPWHRERMPLVA